MAIENPIYIEVLMGTSSINGELSIAMFDYRRVYILYMLHTNLVYVYIYYMIIQMTYDAFIRNIG